MKPTFERFLKEPVLQFLILGGGLFAAYAAFAPPEAAAPEAITVSAARVESLSENFKATWRRPPTEAELNGLIDDYVAEEVFYREALKLDLDEDDLVVRRRMRQKMEVLLENVLALAPPTEEDLRAHFEANMEAYRDPDRITFEQLFLGPAEAANEAPGWAALAQRLNEDPDVDIAAMSAPSALPPGMSDATEASVARAFGQSFAAETASSALNEWSGPIESAYGWHLVHLVAVTPGGDPVFDDMRRRVEQDLAYQRELEARAEFTTRLKAGYDVSVERAER